jgi:hypothetical protein
VHRHIQQSIDSQHMSMVTSARGPIGADRD